MNGSGTVASLDVKTISAKGENRAYGVNGSNGGKLTVTNAETISAESSNGKAYGASASLYADVSITGSESAPTSITATGSGTKYGVNADHFLAGKKEYGGGTVNLNNVSNITASGAGTNYGVWVNGGANGGESVINLNNVGTVTANGGTTNYSAYVSNDSTLNVSTDATTTFNGNIYNAGTISGDNMIVNGGIENNGGSVDITVKSISTDSGVTVMGNAKAAVYAYDGGTTHIGGKGDITISRDAGLAFGAYVDSADVALDVKTITATCKDSTTYGVYVYNGGTLTVTSADAISADSSNSLALGAYASTNSTVSITGSESEPTSITATGKKGSYGVYAYDGSTINLTNVDTVTASGDGTNYSAYVNDSTSTLNVSTDTTTTFNGDVSNTGTFNANSGNIDINGNVANNSNFNVNGGTTTISGDLAGTGSADIASGATLALKNSNVALSGDITNAGTLNFAEGTNTLKDSTVTGSGTTSVSETASLDVSNSTISQNLTNAGTLTGSNLTLNGGIENNGGSVDITVKSISTDSGVTIDEEGIKAAVYAHDGGTTHIGGKGAITISGDADMAYGAYVSGNNTVASLDVNTISAKGKGYYTNGVYVNEGAKFTVTNAETISAESSSGYAYGAFASGSGTDVTLDVKAITANAKGTNNAYGVHAQSGGKLTVTSADIISAESNSDSGKAYGVRVESSGTANLTNVANITATGSGTKYGVNADHFLWNEEEYGGGTVNLNNVSNITASGTGTNYGVWVNGGANGGESVINLNNVDTVTACSGDTNYSAYVSNDSTLNVSTDATTTFNGNIYNAGTINGENMIVNGGIENNGGNVNITVKSISTDSGVAVDDVKAAAVYAHNSGTTYIGGSDGEGAITISGDAGVTTYGAVASGSDTEVSLDVKTITAKGGNAVFGVSAASGGKLTVTSADAISAEGGGGSIYGARATGGTVVLIDVDEITASGSTKKYVEGVTAENDGALTVTGAKKISAVNASADGTAYGAVASNHGQLTLDAEQITALGSGDAYGVWASYNNAVLTVTSADIISADSSNGDAYGAYAESNATVSITGSESKPTSITATGTTNSYGVYAKTGSTINLNNVGTVTASSGDTNYSAYVLENSTLNVSTDTTTTFKGDVKNAGTLNINSGTTTVNGTLDLTGSTATVIKQDGKLVLAEKQKVNFGGENSFVINSDGSFTADAYNGNVLADGGFTVLETAKSAISADKDAIISLRLTTDGTEKSYRTDDLISVREAIYNDKDGKLSFTGGVLALQGDELAVAKKSATDAEGTVTIKSGFDVVDSKNNETKVTDVRDEQTKVVQIVQNGSDGASTLQKIDKINVTGANTTFTAKQLQVESTNGAEQVTLSVQGGSMLKLTGGSTTDSSLVTDKDGNALKTDLEIIENGTLEIGSYAAAETQQGTINKITMTSGTLQLGVASDAASNTKTNYVFDTLNIKDGSETAQINVLNSSLKVNNLNTGRNLNSAIYVDPAYMEIANVNNNTLGVNAYVSAGSVLNLGSVTDLAAIATAAGMNPTQNETGFTVSKDEAVLALNDNYTLAEGTKLIVDAAVDENGNDDNNTNNADVYFGNKSLFVVNGRTASTGAALTLNDQTVDVAEGSKLYINNVQALRTYTIFSGASNIYNWWDKTNISMSKLIEDYDVNPTGTGLEIVVRGYNASNFADTVPYNSIKAMADLGLVDTDADLETSAGIRFLSRATDTNYLTESAMKPTLNEVSTISTTAAIQHAALRATDAMTDAVAEHMSTTLRANDSEIHDGDTTDVWATPFYRSMSWSGGGNDADGYMSGFSFGIDKHAGKNARYGLAMHYGTGSTDSDGAKTDTTNSSKAIGVSLYGSKQWGKLNVMGQIGYTDYDNTMSSYLPSTMNMPTITASPNASTFTADVRAERAYKSGTIDITPHAGVRYTRVMSDSFKTYLSETQSDAQNIVQFPVGVTFGVQRNAADGWKLKGLLDLAVVPVAGNKDAHTSVMFTGLNGVWNDADTAILDSCSFRGSIGFTAERNYFSSNLGYALQTSSNETNHTFRLWLNWKLK